MSVVDPRDGAAAVRGRSAGMPVVARISPFGGGPGVEDEQVQLERSGVRRRLLVLVPIAVIAIVAAACLPPPPPPPPPPTTTTTTQPPAAICGVNALGATAAGADATAGAASGTTKQYV